MKLQFPIGKIAQWADKYDYALQEGDLKRLKDLECAVPTGQEVRLPDPGSVAGGGPLEISPQCRTHREKRRRLREDHHRLRTAHRKRACQDRVADLVEWREVADRIRHPPFLPRREISHLGLSGIVVGRLAGAAAVHLSVLVGVRFVLPRPCRPRGQGYEDVGQGVVGVFQEKTGRMNRSDLPSPPSISTFSASSPAILGMVRRLATHRGRPKQARPGFRSLPGKK